MTSSRRNERRARAADLLGIKDQLAQSTDLLAWSESVRRIGGAPMRIPGYLREIYQCAAPKLVVRKAAQLGGTELAINLLLWAADTGYAGRGNCVYYGPNETSVQGILQARVQPAIAASPYLRQRKAKNGPDNGGLMKIGKGYLYFRSGNSDVQLRSIDADVIALDEFDSMPPEAIALAQYRLNSSRAGRVLILGTPTRPGGGIDRQYLDGDRRVWMVLCPNCGVEQEITWESVSYDGDLAGPDHQLSVNLICQTCGDLMDDALRIAYESGQGARWVATNPDGRYPSYSLSALHLGLDETRRKQLVRAVTSDDPNARKEGYNQFLGLPYAPEGTQLEAALLRRLTHQDSYRAGDTNDVTKLVAGIDVGKRFHVWIEGIRGGLRSLILARAVETVDDLRALLNRYDLKAMVMDDQPDLHTAELLKEEFRGRMFLAHYVPHRWPASWTTSRDQGRAIDERAQYRVLADRTGAIDRFVEGLQGVGSALREWEPTYQFPSDAGVMPELFEHLLAPVRELRSAPHGTQTSTWENRARPDHFFHAGTYAMLARYLLDHADLDSDGFYWTPSGWDDGGGGWSDAVQVGSMGGLDTFIGGAFGR